MSATPSSSASVKERKVSQSASCKIDSIIRQLFLPMLSMPTPERTSFLPEDSEDHLLRQVAQERPCALATESDFVDYMVVLYRRYQAQSQDLFKAFGKESVQIPGVSLASDAALDAASDAALDTASEAVKLLNPGAGEPVL